jgi:hypothetical protein
MSPPRSSKSPCRYGLKVHAHAQGLGDAPTRLVGREEAQRREPDVKADAGIAVGNVVFRAEVVEEVAAADAELGFEGGCWVIEGDAPTRLVGREEAQRREPDVKADAGIVESETSGIHFFVLRWGMLFFAQRS